MRFLRHYGGPVLGIPPPPYGLKYFGIRGYGQSTSSKRLSCKQLVLDELVCSRMRVECQAGVPHNSLPH